MNDLLTGVVGSDSSDGLSLGVNEIRDRKRSLKCISNGSDNRLLGRLLVELFRFFILFNSFMLLPFASSFCADFLRRFALFARIFTACQITLSLNSEWIVLDLSIFLLEFQNCCLFNCWFDSGIVSGMSLVVFSIQVDCVDWLLR